MPEEILFDRYEVLGQLGSGGMGTVCKVRDTLNGGEYALKQVKPGPDDDSGLQLRFKREYRAMLKLRHPGVVRVHDFHEGPEGQGYSMDLISGETFMAAFQARHPGGVSFADGNPSLATALDWLIQALEALAYVHGHGMVHRDIKPSNILVDRAGRVVITDFGLVRRDAPEESGQATQAGHVVGTLAYMAPEQARGVSVDHRADLYSLGVIAYELLTGHHPFAGRKGTALLLAHLNDPVVRPQALAPKLPKELDELLTACLEKAPHRRPGYAQEIAVRLGRIKTARDMEQTVDLPQSATTALPAELAIGKPDSSSHEKRAFLLSPPFIGREAELAKADELQQRVRDSAHPRPGFWLAISGQSGVGKSRLLKTLCEAAKLQECQTLEFDCPEQVRPALESVAMTVNALLPALQQESGDDFSGEDHAMLAAWLPGVKSGDHNPISNASPELIASKGLSLFTRMIRTACRNKPLLIVIDNAQWLDLESARVWNHLHRELIVVPQAAQGEKGERLGLIYGIRAEEKLADALKGLRAALGKKEATELPLSPFTETESVGFIQRILGQSFPPRQFGGRIHRETEGNPFFIEETLKALVDSDVLRFDPGRADPWDIAGHQGDSDYDRLKLPESVQQVLEKRLEGFSDDGLKLVRFAAALGKKFHFDALLAASELDEDNALDLLDGAIKRQIIAEGDDQGHWFLFQHDKLRDVILAQAGPRRVRRMHERLYDILRLKPGWCASPDPREDLALHALRAENDAAALDLLLGAGEAHFQSALPEKAYGLLEQAHGCLSRLSAADPSAELERQLELLERLVASGLLTGRFKAAEAWADHYLELSARMDRHAAPLPVVSTIETRFFEPRFDPTLINTVVQVYVCDPIHRGLLRYHAIGKVIPALAENWAISSGGRVWTFTLRADALLHNGHPVTSRDVVASWERLVSPRLNSMYHWLLDSIKGVREFRAGDAAAISGLEIVDDRTLRVHLREPSAIFPYLIAHPNASILSAGEIAAVPMNPDPDNPAGCGPYRIAEKSDRQFTYQRSDDSAPAGCAPETQKMDYGANRVEEALDGLRTGRFDYICSDMIDMHHLAPILSPETPCLRLASQLGLHTNFIALRCDIPPFHDVRVRRAFCHALDRGEITRLIYGVWAVPAHGLLPPGMLGYDPELPGYDFQPDRVRRLLSEAGHPEGFSLQIFRPKLKGIQSRLSDHITPLLHDLGFRITWTDLSPEEYRARFKLVGRSILSITGWYADYPDPDNFFYPSFHSKSNTYGMNFSDPQFDQWIDEGRQTDDREARSEIYRRAERRLLELAPAAFICHTKSAAVYNGDKLAKPLLSLTSPLVQLDTLRPARKAKR